MESVNEINSLSAALLARVQAAAVEEHRSTTEIMREAVERYLESRRANGGASTENDARADKGLAAAAQIRELRKGNILPEGVTIRDLINEGRD
jgi:predicted transcriptional regulator